MRKKQDIIWERSTLWESVERMGNPISEKEPPGVPGNADTGNQVGREQSGTVEIDE